jgi:CRP-like cAMP-binding protein
VKAVTTDVLDVESAAQANAVVERPGERNRLINLLPLEARARLVRELEPVSLTEERVVIESGQHAKHVYFPQDSVLSLRCVTREGASVEFALVGHEGLLGAEALVIGGRAHGRAVVVCGGHALRLPARLLTEIFRRDRQFRSGLLAFYRAFNTQVIQRSICHRMHTIEEQLCTWLLLLLDRTGRDEIEATHEWIGDTLGRRREGVSIAVGRLRTRGLIRIAYRRLVIYDRAGLQARSCECYAVIRNRYERSQPGRRSLRATQEVEGWLQ